MIDWKSIKQKKQLCHGGFSLVEMLVYIGLLTLISVSAMSLLLTLRQLVDEYRADQHLTESAQIALERILYEVRAADMLDVTNPNSVLVDTPGHLAIIKDAIETEFYVSSGQLMVAENGVELGPLTKDTVTVTELRFWPYDNGETEAIRVTFTLTANVKEATATASFNGSAVLRGTYE